MRQSGKAAKLQKVMREGRPSDRREALALQADAEFADDGHDARSGGGYGRRHPPPGRG
ncbi:MULTISPECIES: hypothetical protein [Cohnella]|jgi:hypothetical protein|uniref:hypothetical protein n=1 Tax=Cohnella TaxID=329857 RepID=UPI00035C2FED|nr:MULTISPECIES: hypothetical protein [Cohnella]